MYRKKWSQSVCENQCLKISSWLLVAVPSLITPVALDCYLRAPFPTTSSQIRKKSKDMDEILTFHMLYILPISINDKDTKECNLPSMNQYKSH